MKDNIIYEREARAAKVKLKDIRRIVNGLDKYVRQAEALGLSLFGGCGALMVHEALWSSTHKEGPIVIAHIWGSIDGGDGGCTVAKDGLLRADDMMA